MNNIINEITQSPVGLSTKKCQVYVNDHNTLYEEFLFFFFNEKEN